jgi:L-lactate utilization protein LutC
MERAQFLARIEERLKTPAPPNLPHPLAEVDGVPEVIYTRPIGDPVEAFIRVAGQVGSTVRAIGNDGDFEGLLDEVLAASDVTAATVSDDPETEGMGRRLEARGIDVVAFDSPHAISEVQLGIVGAAWGIAATGTTVFDAGRAGGRTASLVPPAILVLVQAEQILSQPSDLFRSMGERFPAGVPSQFVLASGPSRTGDIELILTMGVHGPRSVWVGVLQDAG